MNKSKALTIGNNEMVNVAGAWISVDVVEARSCCTLSDVVVVSDPQAMVDMQIFSIYCKL